MHEWHLAPARLFTKEEHTKKSLEQNLIEWTFFSISNITFYCCCGVGDISGHNHCNFLGILNNDSKASVCGDPS